MHTRLLLSAVLLVLAALCTALPAHQASAADEKAIADKKASADKKKAERKANAEAKKKLTRTLQSGDVKESGLYEMSQDELAMDCKRLTGSMKITMTRLRDAATRKGGSGLAESTHKTMPLLFGGSTVAADRQASLARERAKLDAYNRQLAAKGCKTLDIEAELARAPEAPKKY